MRRKFIDCHMYDNKKYLETFHILLKISILAIPTYCNNEKIRINIDAI